MPIEPPEDSVLYPEAFSSHARLAEVRCYVLDNLSGDLSLERVAKVAGVSPKYFSDYFREKTGTHFSVWVRILRVQRAMELFEAA
jgi:AraC-like DNA-binding protein